jgi:hypothetical protein
MPLPPCIVCYVAGLCWFYIWCFIFISAVNIKEMKNGSYFSAQKTLNKDFCSYGYQGE